MNLRCDIRSHTWKAPKRAKTCVEGDYGSTLELTKRGRARFGCVSDAIDPTKLLKYGVLWKFGPFSCRVRDDRPALQERREARLVRVEGHYRRF